jgi:hypothetical protein
MARQSCSISTSVAMDSGLDASHRPGMTAEAHEALPFSRRFPSPRPSPRKGGEREKASRGFNLTRKRGDREKKEVAYAVPGLIACKTVAGITSSRRRGERSDCEAIRVRGKATQPPPPSHSGTRHLARASDAQLRIGEPITTKLHLGHDGAAIVFNINIGGYGFRARCFASPRNDDRGTPGWARSAAPE